jgi:hypothetical protein
MAAIKVPRSVFAHYASDWLTSRFNTIVNTQSDGLLRRSPPNRSVEIHEPGERLALIQ